MSSSPSSRKAGTCPQMIKPDIWRFSAASGSQKTGRSVQMSYGHPEFVAVDKETNDDIMHLNRLGKADRLAGQALNPGT